MFFNVCLHLCSFLLPNSSWLAEIWQLSPRGATGELQVEFKFQRRSCKLSFLPCPAAKALRRACPGLQRDLNLWPRDTSANCSNQLSHEATDVGTWSIMCSKCSRERDECDKCISNKSYIKTAEMKSNEEWSSQLWTQFMQLHKKPEKIQDISRIWTHDLVIQREREHLS